MDWTEQTSQVMKTWTEAQKKLWSGWMEWAQGAGSAQGMPMMFDPTQWMRMGVDTWSGMKDGSAERLAGNIFGTPEIMSRSMNLVMKAWQAVAPKVEAGQPWQPDLKKLLDSWRDEMTNAPKRMSSMANDFAQLNKVLFERWTPVTAPWLAMVSQATAAGHPGAAFMAGTAGPSQFAGLGEFFQFSSGLGQMNVGELPRATVVREKMGKFLKVFDSLSDLQEAQKEYQKALSASIAKSVERTVEHLAKMAEKGEKVSSARDLMRTFYGIADKTMMEAFNTGDFLAIQEKLTGALMNHKLRQREAMEIVYASMELPTRSEIDEAYRDIHELKREVRALKKALKDQTTKVAAKKKPASSEVAAS